VLFFSRDVPVGALRAVRGARAHEIGDSARRQEAMKIVVQERDRMCPTRMSQGRNVAALVACRVLLVKNNFSKAKQKEALK